MMSEIVQRLNNYLVEARACLDDASVCHVVIGNQAADLDSIASAIMYASLVAGELGEDGVGLPVIDIPREDFVLRTEAVYLFRSLGIDEAALVFADEIDLDALNGEGRLRLTLVDHNALASGRANLAETVVAIIDHHDDSGLYPKANPRLIEPVGSAATLVADAILRRRPQLIGRCAATLLLGTILLDTVNLDAGAGRVTEMDRAVATRLADAAGTDPAALFANLQREKFNISGLSTRDLLRKDRKQWREGDVAYAISSVLASLEEWIAKDPGMVAGCSSFRRAHGLDCLLVMMAFTDDDGGFRRQLGVFAKDRALRRNIIDGLAACDIGLSPIVADGLAGAEDACLFNQADSSASRKKLQPLLQRLLAGSDA